MDSDSQVEQLRSRAEYLFVEFVQGGGVDRINQAIILGRQALELCPPGHSKRWVYLSQLQRHLWNRYNKVGTMMDLEDDIVLAREALEICPRGHPNRSLSLNNIAAFLSARYEQLGWMTDLEEAIVVGRESLHLCPRGHPERSMRLNNLAAYLSILYRHRGGMENLDEAIVHGREALHVCPRGHSDRSARLNNVAHCLSTRYKQLGQLADLDEAIVYGQESLDLCPRGHQDRSMRLNNFADYIFSRYTRLGRMVDLDQAVILGREALHLRTSGHPLRSASLNNVGLYVTTRYKQLGVMADLNEAIVLGKETLSLCPQGHPDRAICLNNLAARLSMRFNQLEETTDLDDAIIFARAALNLCPQGHPNRSMSLNNLALYISTRHKQLGELADLDEAISLGRGSLDLRPRGHPDRSSTLNNLAAGLSTRFDQLGVVADLDEAILFARESFNLRPFGDPERSRSLYNLTRCFRTRFTQSHQLKDYEDLFSVYAELTNVPQMVSSSDMLAAKAWINTAEAFHHPTTVLAYETSLRLLIHHLATLPSLPQHLPILKRLTSSLAVDAFSACLRNCHPEKAVELLEQGRGVFWNQIMRLRSPLDDAIASGPIGKILADEFARLSTLIRDVTNSPGPDQYNQLCHLNFEMQGIVTNIRELPGLERFLLPSLFSDLRGAASCGPVIIVNASQYACNALVVFVDRDPVHIPLQITKSRVRDVSSEVRSLTLRAKTMDVRKDLGCILRELWDDVVLPIVEFLQTTLPSLSRIWWCPTAEFSLLPLHAAGPYRKGQKNLSRLFISSYTPTLAALIRARRHNPSSSVTLGKRVVGIGQASTSGASKLVSVGSELAIVGQRIGSLATFTRVEGPESCILRVSEELFKNEWIHLACHGVPNRKNPFDSAFALHDGHFTIQHIMRCELENAEFAYLSACHTTVGDEESPDEVIHLASAMQFAGFRSVIGTMWAVDDAETNKITSTFYENMINESGSPDHTRAALALNKTMNSLVGIPFDQRVLYVHIGV